MKSMKINTENINSSELALSVRKILTDCADEKYRQFTSNLLPGIDNVLGVRIPQIREIANKLSEKDTLKYLEYFNSNKELYFEEIMLQGLIIGRINRSNNSIETVQQFLKKINSWSVCDSFCASLKAVAKNRVEYLELIKWCIESNKIYYQRFAVVLLLDYYIIDDYIDEVISILGSIKSEEYYVNMAVAWAVSICFIKYSDKTMKLLKSNLLNDFTQNKAIQKIRESYRVEKSIKEEIKSLRR